jgi:uncharacterized protein DUF3800
MYLMYVDESGDTGVTNSPTKHFALSSLIVHELRWQTALQQLIEFRRRMRDRFGLLMTEEIHASGMINRPGPLVRIKRNDRLTILRALLDEITHLPDVNLINVVVDKRPSDTSDVVFDRAWSALIQRFEDTLSHRNFPGPANPDERGLIICDETDLRLNRLLRRMRFAGSYLCFARSRRRTTATGWFTFADNSSQKKGAPFGARVNPTTQTSRGSDSSSMYVRMT